MAPRKSIRLKLGVSATSVMFLFVGQAKKRMMIAAKPIGTLQTSAACHWHQKLVLGDLLDPENPPPCRGTGYYATKNGTTNTGGCHRDSKDTDNNRQELRR